MPTFPHPETFVLHTRAVTGRDADGNDIYSTVDTTVTGALAPAGTTELIQGQTTVIEHDTVYLSDGSPIPKASDTMTVRGVERQIDGAPDLYHNPFTGDEPGAVVRLLEVS